MGLLECSRIVLYVIEWIWTTVILGIFPNQLAVKAPTIDGGFEDACLFNANVGRSRCNFGVSSPSAVNRSQSYMPFPTNPSHFLTHVHFLHLGQILFALVGCMGCHRVYRAHCNYYVVRNGVLLNCPTSGKC